MKINWFDNTNQDNKTNPARDRALVKDWVKNHEEELHEIFHLANDNEMEAVKVIDGDQEIDRGGRIILRTLEFHFMKELIVVLRTEETQDSGAYTMKKTATQLGYLEIPSCRDSCDCSRHITKKEIK